MNKTIRLIAFALAFILPSVVGAQQSVATPESEQTYFDYQVEQAVKIKSSRPPVYPDRLRTANIEGQVLVQFVVDEHGAAVMNTFKVIKSTDNELSESVRRALLATAFYPAEVGGKKVKQLVQLPYKFTTRQ